MSDKELLNEFIKYFDEDKYKFENFCKIFLEWLGFDNISVTKRSGDGGIDLKCTKSEIPELNLNSINYIIQAKCKIQENKVDAKSIRDFKGTKSLDSTRRIFITTSDYTSGAINEADDDNNKVTLINGKQIINYLKTLNDKVFDVRYYFNEQNIDALFDNEFKEAMSNNLNTVSRTITKNDVRARILRYPTEYKNYLSNYSKYKLSINKTEPQYYNLDKTKTYFAGVTKFYKDFITNLNFSGSTSMWSFDEKNEIFYVDIK